MIPFSLSHLSILYLPFHFAQNLTLFSLHTASIGNGVCNSDHKTKVSLVSKCSNPEVWVTSTTITDYHKAFWVAILVEIMVFVMGLLNLLHILK